ncbi:MAG: potassium channel family protein [Candidatus Ozemobacteraceae bacterium]
MNIEQETILLKLVKIFGELQCFSPTHWFPNFLSRHNSTDKKIIRANFTDFYILFRLVVAVTIWMSIRSAPSLCWISPIILFEMAVAYISHFFTDKFNSAGPRQVTSVRRTIIIMTINYISMIFLFAILYQHFNLNGRVDSFYFSVVTATTLGYGDVLPKSPAVKILASIEALAGLFQIAVVFGSIMGWSQIRHPMEEPSSNAKTDNNTHSPTN